MYYHQHINILLYYEKIYSDQLNICFIVLLQDHIEVLL